MNRVGGGGTRTSSRTSRALRNDRKGLVETATCEVRAPPRANVSTRGTRLVGVRVGTVDRVRAKVINTGRLLCGSRSAKTRTSTLLLGVALIITHEDRIARMSARKRSLRVDLMAVYWSEVTRLIQGCGGRSCVRTRSSSDSSGTRLIGGRIESRSRKKGVSATGRRDWVCSGWVNQRMIIPIALPELMRLETSIVEVEPAYRSGVGAGDKTRHSLYVGNRRMLAPVFSIRSVVTKVWESTYSMP